jgi:hypothetical protein
LEEAQQVLCVDCFSNHGIRVEAARIAVADGAPCPNCGGSGARLTSQEQVDSLLRKFFEHGTTAPAGRWEPLFKLGSGKLHLLHDVVFDKTLRSDYALLLQHSSGTVFHNAPNTWRLGYTTIAANLEEAIDSASNPSQDELVARLMDRTIDHCVVSVIPKGRSIYRLRINLDQPFDPTQFDAPPTALDSRARFSGGSQPTFYGAFDVETCLHECRVLAEHKLTLATLTTTRDLRLVDLTHVPYDGPDEKGGEGGDLFYFINSRLVFGSRSVTSRLFGLRIRERGFDGIVYPSFFSDVRPNCERNPNVALFGNPLREGTVVLSSLNSLRLDTIRYDFTFGPATQALSRDDLEDLLKLTSSFGSDRVPQDAFRRLEEIISRSDPKD